ncbi:oligosaccharide flippase family protein [Klebsiella oxytoca]|uniref:oligosaccharide flippase family protein n=1 Tax=Klebsiella TaxID=570 RepID=UPI002DB77A27|nr:oligosaccharide flippase family protein [Klebsiella oxytoca]MEB7875101.1 oligosaccharide flippase family protein [Klebsiella oxytoca]HBM3267408.1 oligosaccharide flippase family protein [Klebsiella oxytoca]
MISKHKIRSAALWSAFEAISSAGLSVISIVFLARILKPEDYGQIAAAQIIAALLVLIFSLGLSEAVIQKKNLSINHQLTVFWGSCASALIVLCICLSIAFYLYFFGSSKVVGLVLVFEGIGAALQLLVILPTGLLLKNLDVSVLTKRNLISRVVFFIIAIPMALYGYGLWSIVFANLFQYLIAFILIFYQSRNIIPRGYYFNFRQFIELCRFGLFVMLENLLWTVLTRVFSLLILNFHGTTQLGIYNISTRLTDAVLNILNTVIGRMALPVFSSVQDDRQKLASFFFNATKLFNIVSMPAFVGLAFTCQYWIPVVLGTQWVEAIPIIQIIAIMNAIMFSRIFVSQLMKAVGESRRFLFLSFTSAFVAIAAALVTAKFSLYETMLAWSSMRVLITIPLGIYLVNKILHINAFEQLRPIILPFVVTAIMIFVMVAFRILSERFVLSNIISITLEIALGVITYSFTMAFLIKTKKIILR